MDSPSASGMQYSVTPNSFFVKSIMIRTLMILPMIAPTFPMRAAIPTFSPGRLMPSMKVVTMSPIPNAVPRLVSAGS